MGAQAPPNMIAFIVVVVTTTIAIIALGLSGYLCDIGYSRVGGTPNAACGMGVTAAVLGLILGIVGILWLLISELWDVGILRFVLVFGFAFVGLLAFIAGVLFAVVAIAFQNAAAAAFEFILFICAIGSAIFCFMAGGGGTASA